MLRYACLILAYQHIIEIHLASTFGVTHLSDLVFQPIRSSTETVLQPGRNIITLALPPQKPGSYVLGVITGQIGKLRFRSHSFSKGDPADSDDFMSYEKPTRPILKVMNVKLCLEDDQSNL